MIEALSVDLFSLHYRFPVVLRLAMEFRAPILENHLPLHFFHGVPITVILVVSRLSNNSHIIREVVLSVVILGTLQEIISDFRWVDLIRVLKI